MLLHVSCPEKAFYGVPSYRLVLHTSLCFISTHVNCCSTVVRPCMPDYGCLVLHECVVLPCSSPGQCSAPQTTCGMEGLSTGGLLPRDTLHITTYPPSSLTPPLSLLPQVCYTAICTLGWLPALHTPSQVLLLLRLSSLPDLSG